LVEFSLPRRIFYNEPVESVLPQVIETFNIKSVLVVTDKVVKELSFFKEIINALKGVKFEIFDAIEPEPPLEVGEKVAKIIKEINADAVIAIGGGSVIDSAKAGVVKARRPEISIEDVAPFKPLNIELNKPIIIAIPTTSGTGSDASYAIVLTKVQEGKRTKIDVASPEIVPYIVILDPKIPAGMPRNLTVGTALDALTHATESIASVNSNIFTDALAYKVIETIFESLPKVLKEPNDLEARAKLHLAATMAGMAFSNSGLGLAHALGHPLGAALHIHHGTIVGLLLPYVVDFNYEDAEAKKKYEYVKRLLETSLNLPKREKLSDHIRELYKEIGFPLRLRDLGIKKEDLDSVKDWVAEETLHDPTLAFNPRVPTPEELKELLNKIY
jgi:alcohol dehydrogenase